MAVDLLGHRAFAGGEQQLAFQEAAAAGLRSLELLASSLSPRAEQKPLGQIADQAVSRFRRVINLLDRTGHARFRRAPPKALDSSAPATTTTTPSPAVAQKPEKSLLALDFTKPAAKASAASAATSTSFLSSVTVGGNGGEGSVSKGQSPVAVSCGKPPLPTKRKQHPSTAPTTHHHGGCHCSRTKNSKRARKPVTVVRVPVGPAPSAPPPAAPKPWSAQQQQQRAAAVDVPADEHSWRKYGQKPIKGSPFPRGYYRCSSVKGCPARKHVERDAADPGTLLVTYEGEHRHQEAIAAAGGDARVVVA